MNKHEEKGIQFCFIQFCFNLFNFVLKQCKDNSRSCKMTQEQVFAQTYQFGSCFCLFGTGGDPSEWSSFWVSQIITDKHECHGQSMNVMDKAWMSWAKHECHGHTEIRQVLRIMSMKTFRYRCRVWSSHKQTSWVNKVDQNLWVPIPILIFSGSLAMPSVLLCHETVLLMSQV